MGKCYKWSEILRKYPIGVLKNVVIQTVVKVDDNYDPRASTILKDPNEKLVIENIEDKNEVNAVALIGRHTPIDYFTYIEKDFQYIKPKEYTDYSKLDIFHRAISPILVIGQSFSLLPVLGIGNSNPHHLHFSYKSIPMIITVIFFIASATLNVATVKHLAKVGINAKNLVEIVFFSCVQTSTILFFALAHRWPDLIRYWTRTEMIFVRKPYEMPKYPLAPRIRRAAYAIIILSATEHVFYLISAVISQYRKASICASAKNGTVKFTFEDFTYRNYEYAYEVFPNTKLVGVMVVVVNFFCTFVWNFMDIFIMMIGKGIAYRFEQIKMRINKLLDKDIPESIFRDIRNHYVKLIELLEYVDDNLSGIILLSCANNLYYVCYQLLNIFNKLRWPINYVYFWFSLLFLIGRTAFVYLTAASINDEAKEVLNVLRRIPATTWCVEMAGTIVTYELVLLQFDEPNRSKGLPDLCT